jgi:hypothetical protein
VTPSRRITAGLLAVAAAAGLALGVAAPASAAPAAAPAHVAPALPPGTLDSIYSTQAECIAAGNAGQAGGYWESYICTTAGVQHGWYGLYVRDL